MSPTLPLVIRSGVAQPRKRKAKKVKEEGTNPTGWDLPIETDLSDANEDPLENDLDKVRSHTRLLLKEAACCHDLYYSACDKIQWWFQYHGQKTLTTKKHPGVSLPISTMSYYDTLIKAVVDHKFKELCAKAKATNSPLPQRVHVLNQTVKCFLEEESPEFQAEMVQRQEAEYVADTEAFSNLSSMSAAAPCMPEDFDRELDTAGKWLGPFADYLLGCVGMNISILLTSPVGRNGGAIELHGIHSGKSTEL
ncbi:uncharacterized protein TRAVEDRAFT_48100 [Trametes versicolor FP-101664 SS1]|uniref:uncharacterized protein n=1 Tax=Trametes versicolor (strain FP-101664) TaxID=717944 RepID=UPI0004623C94|nr:uncharacterized protein TRAVEDRAFT_48100 [Trametes versicolor FP-101664 SS1]EIW58966.1 hypothetical protein TRAVEDRAFT_48100 [Trametes versicolor FP-101664 SS1]